MSSRPIIFFDVEPWEQERLPAHIAGHTVVSRPERLDRETALLAREAAAVSVFAWSAVSRPVLEQLPAVRFIAARSTGFDHIDLAACAEFGIAVANVPGYGERTVAEHTFALILALSRNLMHSFDRTRAGSFSREGLRGFDLEGKRLGVIGTGKIGAKVSRIGLAFGMRVVAFDVQRNPELEAAGVDYVPSAAAVLGQADVITLHVPLTEETRHLISMETIERIQPGAVLINTARGDLVQTAALLSALDRGILRGAGLDVLEDERLVGEEAEVLSQGAPSNEALAAMLRNHVLLSKPNVLITPHNAFNSEESLEKLLATTVANLEAFFAGTPQNVVGVS
ncbi:MAG: hydroxyacid dehydrogenase [Candidatus Andersenbacteria bacterium CG10_big_fil_rev_8_21_14_0_10_54_11]|uniref:Hydroxyacid dehydrogenase n=1 Tax=Candidatus Andersenbacteria bacterium CG10_big_fil_rev_8_21_14_0_10_54_11 TaxID=1974485 RepID=A0A2M6X0D5_9BACT|nr:MAG: hydroxyacid dehydrogenase [Candidatus Andersenbacteria bacterium CG10_big_fil_rev_8_21_14_0_10_54_11]